MPMQRPVISYPIPLYQNVPIHPEFYQPRRFVISDLAFGETTTVTTLLDHDYVLGQNIRLLIPAIYGSYELNYKQGIVISIPTTNQVVVNIYSAGTTTFIPSPYTSIITNITQAINAVVTTNNPFHVGNHVIFSAVAGMTEINAMVGNIVARSPTSLTVDIDSSGFSPYVSGGLLSLYNIPQNQAQIIALGDVNTGPINSHGRVDQITYIPGSFINISP
jgi:Ubiquitin-activating enzyme E1 FCCH domain